MNKEEYIALLNYQQLSPTVRKGLEQLIEERFKLGKALDKACKLVANYSGSCPLDSYDIDLDCEDRCESNTKDCWKVWCLKDE